MPVVVALGGNALLRRGQPPGVAGQRAQVERAARALAPIAHEQALVVTHGNGPQVGWLALRDAAPGASPSGLDVLGAETQGMIGYLVEEALREALPGREVATLLTQVVVERADPAFAAPSKPIGPMYDAATARRLARERGWSVAPDGDGFRRVVPSPEPRRILELSAVRALLAAGLIVVCAGGGGIPVVLDPDGALHGVEAVIDKDLASALLAIELRAERLVLLTDVAAVEDGWRTSAARAIRRATVSEMRARDFAPGSMGPKVEAACRFVERTGRTAAIGALEQAAEVSAGRRGTQVVPDAGGG